MPNSRRRRFSVQNDMSREQPKSQNGQFSRIAAETNPEGNIPVLSMPRRSKNRMHPSSSRLSHHLEVLEEAESVASSEALPTPSSTCILVDKDVMASSSNINFVSAVAAFAPVEDTKLCVNRRTEETKMTNTDAIQGNRRRDIHPNYEKIMSKRDKYIRQHRVKVRSPKRKLLLIDTPKPRADCRCNVSTETMAWEQETVEPKFSIDEFLNTAVESPNMTLSEEVDDRARLSTHSLADMCRICHGGDGLSPELGQLISACSCRGTVGRVHVKCLERWLTESGKSRCELCGTRYATRRVHRYGVPRALVLWILSQNAKQLMVDSLGIMLMSPLAVLAAWLSGRTLAGLMTQDTQTTPWPLASTFVLACMTLVCYYCWIVSAATRHALGWWIWYRSQYEVRLQLEETEE